MTTTTTVSSAEVLGTGKELDRPMGRLFEKDIYTLFAEFAQIIDLKVWVLPAKDEPTHIFTFSREAAIRALRKLCCSRFSANDSITPSTLFYAFQSSHLISRCSKYRAQLHVSDPESVRLYITAKGLHILETVLGSQHSLCQRLLRPEPGSAEKSGNVPTSPIVCSRLLHLERDSKTNEIILSSATISSIFRRVIGSKPNITPIVTWDPAQSRPISSYRKWSKGIPLYLWSVPTSTTHLPEFLFSGKIFVKWIGNFTTTLNDEEAGAIGRQLLRNKFIHQGNDRAVARLMLLVAKEEYRGKTTVKCFESSHSATYSITDLALQQLPQKHENPHPKLKLSELSDPDSNIDPESPAQFNAIIDHPPSLELFRKFLMQQAVAQNLHFWLNMTTFLRNYPCRSGTRGFSLQELERESSEIRAALTPSADFVRIDRSLPLHGPDLDRFLKQCEDLYEQAREVFVDTSIQRNFKVITEDLSWILDDLKSKRGHGTGKKDCHHRKKSNDSYPTHVYYLMRRLLAVQGVAYNGLINDRMPEFLRTPAYIRLKSKHMPVAPSSRKLQTTGTWMTISQYGLEQEMSVVGLSSTTSA